MPVRAGLDWRLVLATSRRPWARWEKDTGQHIVRLRAFALGDRWEPAIELTLRPLWIAVRAA